MLLSMVAALLVAVMLIRRERVEPVADLSARRLRHGALHPLTQFFVTCFVIGINQVVFSAFTLAVHHGDPSFLKRYLGDGWCAVDLHHPLVRFVASFISAKEEHPILLLSALRVQAFLELPFTIFAYLAVTRMLSASLYRRLTSLPIIVLVGVFFTAPFCLAELSLPNPWTNDDLIIRLVAAFAVPAYVWIISRRELPRPITDSRPTALSLLTFLAGAGAIAVIVLALYDAFLLYNFAHLARYSHAILVSVIVATLASIFTPRRIDATVARFIRPRSSFGQTSFAIGAIQHALVFFAAIFFVPSLSIRYWATHPIAQLSGVLLITAGVVAGMFYLARAHQALGGEAGKREQPVARMDSRRARGVWGGAGGAPSRLGAVLSLIVGFAAACLGGLYAALTNEFTNELVIAGVAIGFLVPLIAVTRVTEVALNTLIASLRPAETDAQTS